ncbi:MAG: hypothetical protein JXA49_10650 [Actinobacteria bacterium]|nr:hypothetical protein [Actinomycetota bacterium]
MDLIPPVGAECYESTKRDGMNSIRDSFEAWGFGGNPDKAVSVLQGGHTLRSLLQWTVQGRFGLTPVNMVINPGACLLPDSG